MGLRANIKRVAAFIAGIPKGCVMPDTEQMPPSDLNFVTTLAAPGF
jgi:hypothetical protein